MDSPKALSTVYAVAAEALAVTEPLDSLQFESPVPYTRTHLVAATTKVTGLDVASILDDDVEEDTVFQACGLVLAKAVGNTAENPEEVVDVFRHAFEQLIAAYCNLSRQRVTHFRNVVSVADAIALEIALLNSWPYVRPRRRDE